MEQRGRKSADALALQQFVGAAAVQRPDAPYELSDEQAAVWRAVVDSMPADWFGRETQDLLTHYCRHVVAARRVAQLVNALEQGEGPIDSNEYDRLLKMQEREGRAMSSLATRMRLTQQTHYSAKKSREGRVAKKPWQT